ncbi:MAG: SMP-30/gluconolactonase/LRE family protein [Candidatus Eisenbacteria bacterium]|uniref:SMP-30/gluconolactonase/LRE family protein n=1 Tax=Eiseniibacteriota bacterium TaxID=2212470 RepID=A0A849SLR8_UNCEI|nr:SMP-30/gluconolactonase/LRE family protein [Candidatus Eisenbacteria bacterium]
MRTLRLLCSAALFAALFAVSARAQAPAGTPDATLDLATREGVATVRGAWRTSETKISEIDFRSVGADLKASGPANRTFDFAPHAEGVAFDDSQWETIDPTTLGARRSTGKLCFNWYRLSVTVPTKVGTFDPTGATLVFETVVDDYAEVWVDGVLARSLGQTGGSVVAGWNVPNRLVIGRDVKPGQKIQLAVFGINGPISAVPENYIWVRSARLDFYRPDRDALKFPAVAADLVRKDAAIDGLFARDARVEKLADGFQFAEGPVWARDGSLLFSDPNTNVIYRWSPDGKATVFRTKSGYDGADVGRLHQPGSNGLAFDPEGRLTSCEHGNRRVTRLEKDGKLTVLADRYEGKRLNSPNDLVYRSDGALYFTDPPFGLPKAHDDPAREVPYTGVYCWRDGQLKLVSNDLTGPNGLAFSPDERWFYVTNWDTRKKIIMRYEVQRDGSLKNGREFFSMNGAPGEEALDGLKIDQRGNLYASGPGGVWIISPAGKHLGTLRAPELPANLAWGDADGRGLYMTARSGLYRVRLEVAGATATRQLVGEHR